MAKKVVQFDNGGRTIGDNSDAYSSDLGDFSRAHASISYEKWAMVDPDKKKRCLKRSRTSMMFRILHEVNRMEALLEKHDEYFRSTVSRQGPNIQSFAETLRSQNGSPSQASGFPPVGFPPNVRENACKLFSMRGEHAANGRAIIGDRGDKDFESSPERFETYDVFFDRVLLPNVTSTNRDTLGEENISYMITWPKAFTVLAR